ncbi:MAG TPA: DnaJ C-terminal domain-containing protein, partial [Ideonella sp.]|nr:DnaJ C-terminal domain-containing protein [Ideonella sp.]
AAAQPAASKASARGASAAPPPAAPPSPEPEAAEAPRRAPRPWWERDWGSTRWQPDGEAQPSATIRHTARLRLEQAAFGCTHELIGSVADWCVTCTGIGRLVSPRSNCRNCSGEGRVKSTAKAGWRSCAACRGDGADRKACDDCQGSGRQPARGYHFEVRVPPGMRAGQTMLLRGQGQRGAEGGGDIELGIEIQPHPVFSFDAQQRLSCRVPVDFYSSLVDSSLEVPALEGGTLTLDIAAGPLQVLEGRGYPQRDGSRGPLVVQTETVMPREHSAAQRKLLRQLAEERRSSGYAHSPELAAWQERLQAWRAGSETPG